MSSDIVYMPEEGGRRVDMKPYKIRLCLDNTRAIPPAKTLACVVAVLESNNLLRRLNTCVTTATEVVI
jgi:hypothetical protein